LENFAEASRSRRQQQNSSMVEPVDDTYVGRRVVAVHYTSVNCNFDLLWICGTSGQADRDAVWDVESCESKELEGAMYWTEEKKRGNFWEIY